MTHDPPEAFPRVRLEDGIGTVEVDGEVVFRVESPERWWPNGLGEQRLYEVPGLGVSVGFRTLELVQNPGAPDGALPYRWVVNGRELQVNGWNWVPLDALSASLGPEARAPPAAGGRANVNVLRVWGGGLIETTEFYELCNRLGVLV